jgi:DNA ligase (NAD+)
MPPKKQIQNSVDEEFLKFVANKYGVSLPDAIRKVDDCIKRTALASNLSYSLVYATLFPSDVSNYPVLSPKKSVSETILVKNQVCTDLDIQECSKSDSCFTLEPYGCLPRKISDADIINEDPDKYIDAHLTKLPDIERMVKIAAFLYYNYDGGGLTDNSFDALEHHLKGKLKIKGRLYEKIGAPPVDKIRTRLKYPMASLDKIKPGTNECTKFLSNFLGSAFMKPIPCCWSVKLDGVSGQLIYENGKLVEIDTRGDGIIGGNVTYLIDYISTIPRNIKSTAHEIFVVKGEFILSKEAWENKYKDSYANPRAFVSGKINAGFISPALTDIEFVAYEIMYEKLKEDDSNKNVVPQPSHAFKILDIEGFQVADNGVLNSPTVFEIMELYKEKRASSKYYIDGLALSLDKSRKGVIPIDDSTTVVENPTHTVAFKMMVEDQVRYSKIINVDWNISRYGRYVPVGVYEAVYIDGVRLTRATCHNARKVQDCNIGKGTKIKVVRSGDVIPQIKDYEVDASIKPIFPKSYDDGGYEWHWQGSDIVLDEIDTNPEVLVKRVVHFFEIIGIPRIGQKTAEKLAEVGMKSPESIVKASVEDFIKIKGIGKKTAEGYYYGIRKTMAITPPDRFIEASTTFKSGVGRKLLKQLFKEIPRILDLSQPQIEEQFKKKKMPGFGPARIKKISEGIPEFRRYLDSFAKEDVQKAIEHYVQKIQKLDKEGRNPNIEGKKFVTTGFMGSVDMELEDYIFDMNGEFVSTVTSDVSAVISGNIVKLTDKMKEAVDLEVPVLSLEEFCTKFEVPLKRFEKSKPSTEEDEY